MTDTSRRGTAETGTYPGPAIDVEPFIAASQSTLRAMARTHEHMLRHALDMNGELFAFVERRLDTDRETAREIAGCATMAEAYGICGNAMTRMMRDYSDEMGKIAGLVASQARETMEDVQSQIATASDNGAKKADG